MRASDILVADTWDKAVCCAQFCSHETLILVHWMLQIWFSVTTVWIWL